MSFGRALRAKLEDSNKKKRNGKRVAALTRKDHLGNNEKGYAVVEATILFPIIVMIFAGLVLLTVYLPMRAALQQATQYAATVLATERSDTWLDFNTEEMEFERKEFRWELSNVYKAIFDSLSFNTVSDDAETIVKSLDGRSVIRYSGDLTVQCQTVNYVVYKEITVTATRVIPVPVDLSFVKFPTESPVTASSTSVVLNGDEFVRNMDLAAEFFTYLDEKYDLKFSELSGWMEKVYELLGI